MAKSQIKIDLKTLGFTNYYKTFHKGTRDNPNINILKHKTGILITDKTSHIDSEYYENMDSAEYWKESVDIIDIYRRIELIKKYHNHDKMLDVGCGQGEILKHTSVISDGVEPQTRPRSELQTAGFTVYKKLGLVDKRYNLITMFHVLEHIPNQIEYINLVYKTLKEGGTLIIEIPHAGDWLIEMCEAFRDYTFWSEHLILHTEDSILSLLLYCGFDEIQIIREQRYNYLNHQEWTHSGKPRGHKKYVENYEHDTDEIYTDILKGLNKTDTLVIIAKKPERG